MTRNLYEYNRPRRMNYHHAMSIFERWLKEAHRSGELVEPIKGRKRRPKRG